MKNETETETVCRVCGFSGEVFWEGGWPTEAICLCCGNESDVGDASVMGLRGYRGYWVGHGAPWHSPSEERKQKRLGWDLLKQLADIPPEWR
ncbi:hypothetical protein [Streptomyces sp. SID3212]|uniref:hypothetical protein n=1 Tax=unclassified Streptomyces TaxID=2593676 RepID=UPI0013722999|nr:hypothetical protein [Streptomyces sp. SID3212]MYV51928.1 hypothetical protein [Streptomyces sp. SID3212]